MSKQAYIVTGETGEYSDRRQWVASVFLDRAAADAACKALNDWCLDNGVSERGVDWELRDGLFERARILDPLFDNDYTGTGYQVEVARLDDGVDGDAKRPA